LNSCGSVNFGIGIHYIIVLSR